MIATTDEQVMEVLKDEVSKRPDYVYSRPEYMKEIDEASCFYVHQDETGENVSAGCLVGVVLHRLGVPLEELAKREGKPAARVIPHVVTGITHDMVKVLQDAQYAQDEKNTWGEAYAKATGETI